PPRRVVTTIHHNSVARRPADMPGAAPVGGCAPFVLVVQPVLPFQEGTRRRPPMFALLINGYCTSALLRREGASRLLNEKSFLACSFLAARAGFTMITGSPGRAGSPAVTRGHDHVDARVETMPAGAAVGLPGRVGRTNSRGREGRGSYQGGRRAPQEGP